MIYLTGKIKDEDGDAIPMATIFISDKDGKLVNDKARVRSDVDGNYKLPFAIAMPVGYMGANVPVPIGKFITIIAGGYPNKTVSLEESKVNPLDPSTYKNFNVIVPINTQEIEEFTVVASKDAFECKKKGGNWDEKTKTCKLPRSFFDKYKWWIIGGGLLATLTTIILIRKNKK